MKNKLLLALAGLMTAPVFAAGAILEDINMFVPEDGDPTYKITANEKYGTQWYADMVYAYWHGHNTSTDVYDNAHLGLVHAVLNQRLIKNELNGGTWLRAEFYGGWGLDRKSARTSYLVTDGVLSATYPHAEIYGGHDGFLTELAIMHYFAAQRACVIAGMLDLTGYFDAVGIANDSFSGFPNAGFINSPVLALPEANLGAVLQYAVNDTRYPMLGFSRETTTCGYNPFDSGTGYMVVGEYGRQILDGAATIRLNPFFRHVEDVDGHCNNYGIATSIEYEVNDGLTVFARSGWSAHQELGNAFDFSCGANISLIPSREDDFFGLALGVIKGCAPTANNREFVAEAIYSLQVNDYFKIVPHIQYIANPAYDADNSDAVLMGIQGVFSF